MNTDLDQVLARLADIDEHPGLATIDASVFNGIRANRTSVGTGLGATALAAVGAIALGTASAGPLSTPAAAAPLDPFGIANPLAPSTLLLADR